MEGEARPRTNGDASTVTSAGAAPASDTALGTGTGVGVAALAPHESQWVNPGAPPWFIPWPADETIRRGALGQIQARVDAGLDPAVAAAPIAPELEREAKLKQDQIKVESNEAEPAQELAPEQSSKMDKVSSRAGQGRAAEEAKPAVFGGLDLYDPDDD